jgi:uncharacterized protein YaiL (DUF2058 family)
MSKKKDSGWRRRVHGTSQQIGMAFHIEPRGDKSKLPKALQTVSLNEIPQMMEERRRKNMTDEEKDESDLIDVAIQEEIAEQMEAERKKNLLQRLDEALKKSEKKARLKRALEEAKAEQAESESPSGDGYGEQQELLEEKRRLIDQNETFG